jgi:hypothetical protein
MELLSQHTFVNHEVEALYNKIQSSKKA